VKRITMSYDDSAQSLLPGGYMNSPRSSPRATGSPTNSPRKGAKAKNQPLTPVTIRQLLDAPITGGDTNEFVVDGFAVSNVSIVGQILSAEELSTTLNYVIDDGTATIDVRIWTDKDGNDYIRKQSPSWTKGRYVIVIGTVHQFKNIRSIVSSRLVLVEDSNEIIFHHLEALQSHLIRNKGGNISFSNSNSTSTTSNSSSSSKAVKPTPPQRADSGMNDLQTSLVHLIRQGDPKIGASMAELCASLSGLATEEEVKDAVKSLLDEGTIFTTTDDDHFALTDG